MFLMISSSVQQELTKLINTVFQSFFDGSFSSNIQQEAESA